MRRLLCVLCVSLLAGATAQATEYDIGTDVTVMFNSASDTLTNTGNITDWTDATLDFIDGSDFTGVDFTALGFSSWTSGKYGGDSTSRWDGANFSGLTITFTGYNPWHNDSLVGVNFSGATLENDFNGNQTFVFSHLTNANFSGATLKFAAFTTGPTDIRVNAFRGRPMGLSGADFSGIIWGVETPADATSVNQFFDDGPGTTSAANKDRAVTFEGADLSLISGPAKTNMIANLGAFDGPTPIGAKYDDEMLQSSGWTKVELDAAGWQYIPASASAIMLQ